MTAVLDDLRFLQRLGQLADSARTPDGGVTRLAWSPEDLAAGTLVTGWLAPVGLTTRIDAVRNLIADLPGTQPELSPIMMGSHFDTVIEGGELDGAYGALAAFEVLGILAASGERLRHPLRAVAWANEEGVVAPPFTGSLAASGRLVDLDAVGPDSRSLAERLIDSGADPSQLEKVPMGDVAAYLELHIEQGPVLDRSGSRVGVVTGIVGSTRGRIRFEGQANHAGTTPMDHRSDALVAAAHAVLAIEQIGRSDLVNVATVGAIEARPGNANVVAGEALVSFDLRSLDDPKRERAIRRLGEEIDAIAAATGTSASITVEVSTTAVLTDPMLRTAIAGAAANLGVEYVDLSSGAGHDAQCIAAMCPVGMIFVPSIGGISHHRDERSNPADLVTGAQVLLAALRLADERLDQ